MDLSARQGISQVRSKGLGQVSNLAPAGGRSSQRVVVASDLMQQLEFFCMSLESSVSHLDEPVHASNNTFSKALVWRFKR